MGKTLKTKVNNNFEFDFDLEDISNLDISTISDKEHHIILDNTSFHTSIISSNFNTKAYQVSVNNTIYTVNIFNDLDILIKDMGFSIGTKKEVKSITAPMPGLILDIQAKVGQQVSEDDTLVILEAMKMENSITSPIDGVIKSINAKKGDAVEKNQLIIEFE